MSHTATIPAETARHVLFHFGHGDGWRPGSFTQHLMSAFCAADLVNKAQLGGAYPDYAAAIALAENDPDGINLLHAIAKP